MAWFDKAVNHAHQRCLAGARRANDDGQITRVDCQRNIVDGRLRAINTGDV